MRLPFFKFWYGRLEVMLEFLLFLLVAMERKRMYVTTKFIVYDGILLCAAKIQFLISTCGIYSKKSISELCFVNCYSYWFDTLSQDVIMRPEYPLWHPSSHCTGHSRCCADVNRFHGTQLHGYSARKHCNDLHRASHLRCAA